MLTEIYGMCKGCGYIYNKPAKPISPFLQKYAKSIQYNWPRICYVLLYYIYDPHNKEQLDSIIGFLESKATNIDKLFEDAPPIVYDETEPEVPEESDELDEPLEPEQSNSDDDEQSRINDCDYDEYINDCYDIQKLLFSNGIIISS